MAEEQKLYRIGEASRLTATKPFVLRYWETEFPTLHPVKSAKGQRLYRRQDIETVLEIKRLLYDEGFTIAGARRHLKEHGANGGRSASVSLAGLESGRPDPSASLRAGAGATGRGPSPRTRKALADARSELLAILTLLERR